MSTEYRRALLQRANDDYRPGLVMIDAERVRAIQWEASGADAMVIRINGPAGTSPSSALPFLVAMTSINYRFWDRQRDGTLTRYRHLGKTGARALWLAFEHAWGESVAEFAQGFQHGHLWDWFGAIPDPESRATILCEVLTNNWLREVCAEIEREIDATGTVQVGQARLLADAFPAAFGDPYLKKAQLALAAYAGYLRSLARPVNTSDLTAMADYQVPRVLRALGMLSYSPELSRRVDGGELLAPDSAEENAIRAATIIACEAIAAQVGGTAADVDNLLWQSQDVAGEARFHLTETTWY
ncbi:MAG: queuosine salvage family protein [Sulfuritalea sp.]|nr:queuosine salvage family protein [Sulfuritalea sp.]